MNTPSPLALSRRPWGHFVAILAVLLTLGAALAGAEWDFAALTDPERRAAAAARIGEWLVALASPDLSREFLARAWELTLQTLAAAILGTSLAVAAAYPLAMGASRAVCVGEEYARGAWRHFPLRSPRALLCAACRLVQDVLRAVPDFVWAIILVAMIGLGPLTGALALALNITGILARVYSELWDGVEETRYAQVRALGAGRIATFLYGIRPLASRNVLSFTLMRAECAIRNAAVIGAVGGGGLGAEIWYQIRFGAWDKVGTLILFTLLLTLTADLAANHIRRQLRGDPNRAVPSATWTAAGSARAGRAPRAPWWAAAFVGATVAWSVWFMGWGNRDDDGAARNHLAPLGEFVTGEAWARLGFFERLLSPQLDVAFVLRVVESASIPLAIATVGTLLGTAAAIAINHWHSASFQWHAPRFTGETPGVLRRAGRAARLVAARALAMVSRGVPEVTWAFLFIAFFGPGLVAGTLAIAVHTLGVLARVFGEAVDNLPHRRFEPVGASPLVLWGTVAAPMAWRDWMTYIFFQFESNVRAAVVLGLIGVGGLGFEFSFNFEWFRFERASTYLLMMVLLTVLIDRGSRMLRLARVGA
ncbi:MAG: ABC transporter permease subunit [Azoarcus sp.]|nr:ABC transporter permease subunit [Azoarcus sp.]